MTIKNKTVDYSDGDAELQAYVAWDDTHVGVRPGVLVSHAWRGRSDFENGRAQELAKLGYVGFALDLYGRGVLGSDSDENRQLMQPFLDDRKMLQNRLLVALNVLTNQPMVDANKKAAIGYCFGGLCVLDLARIDADVLGVTSFHGVFSPPDNTVGAKTNANILVLHGWDDPMATPEQALGLADELTRMDADWQIHAYGKTTHAFTNPQANDAGHGLMYNANADRRSWDAMTSFLAEIFA